jgi:chorismate mutase
MLIWPCDAVHGLLMRRARGVEQVAKSGKRSAYRPGREASIVRRLLQRHTGALPPQTLVRLWRELLAGTTAMQGPFAIAVFDPDGGTGFTQAAREHFGALTPLRAYGSPAQAIAESPGSAAVAVLPMPSEPIPPGTPGGPHCCRRTSRVRTWWRGCRSGRRGRMARRPCRRW